MRHSRHNDDAWVALVDRILDGTENGTSNLGEKESNQDMEGMVRLLQQHTMPVTPDRELARRIQNRLSSEWRISGPGNKAIQQTKGKKQRLLILGFVSVVVLAVISTFIFMPDVYGNLQGSATEGSPTATIMSLIIILLGITIWSAINYFLRRKK